LTELKEEPLVGLPVGSMLHQLTERVFARAGRQYRAATVAESIADVYALVANGAGLALVGHAPNGAPAGLHYVPLDPPGPRLKIVIAFSSRLPARWAARALLAFATTPAQAV
jgi:DNA-binding transcriptional LysR family regulator